MDTKVIRDRISSVEQPEKQSLLPESRILDSILRLGNIFELDFCISPKGMDDQLKQFSQSWVQYNPYKPEIRRQGLSVTSLDGGMTGNPDLYSLREYYRREGVLYKESDFRTFTPVYEKCPLVQPMLDYFSKHIGRTHFLKLGPGGYFPPHRDGAGMAEPDCFRILVPLLGTRRSNFVFLYNDERFFFEPGNSYFINTLVSHSLFAFNEDATMLICNIRINEESLALLNAKLSHK